MALPSTSKPRGDGIPSLTGIGISLTPGDVYFGTELQRTSDNGSGVAASTGATSIAEIPPGQLTELASVHMDQLPMDGQKRFYRARHIGPGYDAGAWTAWTTGHVPGLLTDLTVILRQQTGYPFKRERKMTDGGFALAAANATGSEFRANLYLPSTYLLNVGTTGTPSVINKTRRLHPCRLQPAGSSYAATIVGQTYLATNTTDSTLLAVGLADIEFPVGSVLTEITFDLFLASTATGFAGATSGASIATGNLRRAATTGFVTLASASHDGAAATWQTKTVALAETVSSSSGAYIIFAELQAGSTLTQHARIGVSAIAYQMNSYDQNL